MENETTPPVADNYTVAHLPLGPADQKQLMKDLAIACFLNLLLSLPMLACYFLWKGGSAIFIAVIIIVWNIISVSSIISIINSMAHPKTVITGRVARKESNDEYSQLFFGQQGFTITCKGFDSITVGDIVSLHYSQNKKGEKDSLLSLQKQTE